VQQKLVAIHGHHITLAHTISGERSEIPCTGVVLLTDRQPNDALYQALKPHQENGRLKGLSLIGDAEAPNTIERAVFAGHLAAREFDEAPVTGTPFRVERVI
jgi:dimethylamine/trimethylamine dehydrogenase